MNLASLVLSALCHRAPSLVPPLPRCVHCPSHVLPPPSPGHLQCFHRSLRRSRGGAATCVLAACVLAGGGVGWHRDRVPVECRAVVGDGAAGTRGWWAHGGCAVFACERPVHTPRAPRSPVRTVWLSVVCTCAGLGSGQRVAHARGRTLPVGLRHVQRATTPAVPRGCDAHAHALHTCTHQHAPARTP